MIDDEYQKEILRKLLSDYPTYENITEWLDKKFEEDEEKYIANVLYLEEKGYIKSGSIQIGTDRTASVSFPHELTVAGIDFIREDETVILHAEEIRQILYVFVEESKLPVEEKSRYKEAIKDAGPEFLKDCLKQVMGYVVSNAPAIALWGKILLENTLSS
ncbi:MAG: hypothetical protein NC211_07670 [Alistipes senegalensis]|nr:hypothetical protein [Oxalobacter formigenes]MCM1281686.1 hypothetical protein [Alistipes senegalensis]